MPSPKITARQERRNLTTNKRVLARLRFGHDWCFLDWDLGGLEDRSGKFPIDDETMIEVWNEIGDSIVAEHVAKHPGSRPYGWWEYGQGRGQRRRCTSGQHPHDRPGRHQSFDLLYYGLPRCWVGGDPLGLSYECEWVYLQRNGLLMPGELEAAEAMEESDE